ncbi:MAG: DNA translocase FtsK 4TM domain-containing protein [Myxococcota bacterium]
MAAQGTTSTPSSAGDLLAGGDDAYDEAYGEEAFTGEGAERRREVAGLVSGAATALLTLALLSYASESPENLVGPVGVGLAGAFVGAFGIAAWVLPLELLLATFRFFRGRTTPLGVATAASTLVLVLVGCALVHLLLPDQRVHGTHLPGGALGEVVGELLRSMLGLVGAAIVCVTVLLVTVVLRTPVTLTQAARGVLGGLGDAAKNVRESFATAADAWREAQELERLEREAEEDADAPRITWEDVAVEALAEPEVEEPSEPKKRAPKLVRAPSEDASAAEAQDATGEEEAVPAPAKPAKPAKAAKPGPRIIAPKEGPAPEAPLPAPKPKRGSFTLPAPTLLEAHRGERIRVDPAELRANAKRLEEKLASYGVKGRVDEIHPGPVVTMYELEPASGTKISKIAGLESDLALALAARSVRIVAPIPGKARVGIELPNEDRQTVYLREILEDPRWAKSKGALPMALGKDIAGQPVYADLAKMPHLLVAGATGSGKSVGLNVMLASILAKKTPAEVRMLMIDPKVVELAVFDGIPHMLLPVVTDMQKAALALRWAVDEMERRYQLFADAGARNISTYNQRVQKVLRGELAPEKLRKAPKKKKQPDDAPPEELPMPESLPHIVVVVDEFADLMMVAAKDVEACVARLAQKARAAGIHVILATQRPSVDVITGMIKANFPARMAFKVSQREDSKTILGRIGAQNLLGRGDMLMLPPGSSELQRVHSAFISEDEVRAVCDFLRTQGEPVYDERILQPREDGDFAGPKTDDPLYDKAVAVVAQAGYCSISHIQRQLGVGYNKAAKLVDRMEAEGVVGPATKKAGGRREVLISPI